MRIHVVHMNVKKKYLEIALLLSACTFILILAYQAQGEGYQSCIASRVYSTPENTFECGNYYFGVYGSENYDVKKAERYFEKTIALDPSTPDVWHQYARTAFLRGDFAVALFRINQQLERRGDELMAAYYIRGLIYGYAKNYEMAEKDFLKFLEWSPTNWAANNDLAWIYFAQGKYKEAAAQVEPMLLRDPYNVWILVMHAMAVYNLGDVATAKRELTLAKHAAQGLEERHWMLAYPGNDPRLASEGLTNFREAIERNLVLVNSSTSPE